MTIDEVNEVVKQTEAKINEIKSIVSDINACQSDKSKTILLMAATKLADQFRTTPNVK